MGLRYTEHVILEKVNKSGGVDGEWKLESFVQTIATFGPHMPLDVMSTQPLGDGMWMKVHGVMVGTTIVNTVLENNLVLTVRDNRIGYPRTNIWVGEISGERVRFKWHQENPIEPILTGIAVLEGGFDAGISISSPSGGERFVFSADNPGELRITARAVANPASMSDRISWSADPIDGSQLSYEPSNASGPEVTIIYKGLPEENGQFGTKGIYAKLDADGCKAEARVPIRAFYPATVKNNPGGEYPNWFYYWKQTRAANPLGEPISLEYGGRFESDCTDCSVPMLYKPMYMGGGGHKMITVCDLATICVKKKGGKRTTPFEYELPLLSRDMTAADPARVGKLDGWRTVKYMDLFASGLIHELTHYRIDSMWRRGKSIAELHAMDADWDGLPDFSEPAMRFDPAKQQTYLASHPVLKGLKYDEEWLAYETQGQYPSGAFDSEDWAKPGKQWPGAN